MSYMNNAEFAPLAGIQELRMEDIDGVTGGLHPLLIAGAIVAIGFGGGAITRLGFEYLVH